MGLFTLASTAIVGDQCTRIGGVLFVLLHRSDRSSLRRSLPILGTELPTPSASAWLPPLVRGN